MLKGSCFYVVCCVVSSVNASGPRALEGFAGQEARGAKLLDFHHGDQQEEQVVGGGMTSKYRALPGYFSGFVSASEPGRNGLDGSNNEHLQFLHAQSWNELYGSIPDDAKLVILGRHGQGYHNAAEQSYGTPAWDSYWSHLDGDGNITWLDARLTPQGVEEQIDAARTWLVPMVNEIGVPQRFYTSPMRRCLETYIKSWGQVYDHLPVVGSPNVPVHVCENLRETLGVHTCDRRLNHSEVLCAYQHQALGHAAVVDLQYEVCYPEEDALWSPAHRETRAEIDHRLASALDAIFERPERYVSITSHSGAIAAALRAMGHPPVLHLPTSGFVFAVVGPVAPAAADAPDA
ncbi:putative phosphomutase Ecym_6108 [Eremothecium cymbalariae DBVPG|uniref:Phosphoglycerate mutase-like protein n=1 Tax=Eremothecium cymbalariae (strain CBS 270.75 / DBVPG 7215 / KCTC 17166 / NRRL Y-17582) TaxID=931890 RepID=G8JV23_ERECY|nr:hypothetical protein Ecym_6108 [Eremothecium cymbalariae DBVPG\